MTALYLISSCIILLLLYCMFTQVYSSIVDGVYIAIILLLIGSLIVATQSRSAIIIPEYMTDLSPSSRKKIGPDALFKHLSYMTDVLSYYKIPYYVVYGTLLGAVRDNDIIKYDYDFDLGCNVDDYARLIKLNNVIERDGYHLVPAESIGVDYQNSSINRRIWRVSLKVMYMDQEVGDVYLYKKFSDGLNRRFDAKSGTYFWPASTYPSWFTDQLSIVKIRGRSFFAPRDPEILLQHWYGKSWRTPLIPESQGGPKRDGIDFYGGDANIKLSTLIEYLNKRYGIRIVPKRNQRIENIYPTNQISWVKQYDP